MNCPNCGAANEEDARFCAECGTPLERPPEDDEPFIIDQVPDDSDRTVLSSRAELEAEEAATVSVSQEEVVEASAAVPPYGPEDETMVSYEPEPEAEEPVPPPYEAEAEPVSAYEPEVGTVPPGGPPLTGGEELTGGRTNNRTLIIIGVAALLLLCCCCAALLIGSAIALNEGGFNIEDFSLVSPWLALV